MDFEFVRQLQKNGRGGEAGVQIVGGHSVGLLRGPSAKHSCARSVRNQRGNVGCVCSRPGGAFGSRRLRTAVALRGVLMSTYRVRRFMRQNGLRSAWQRNFVHTTDSKHALPISPNVLMRLSIRRSSIKLGGQHQLHPNAQHCNRPSCSADQRRPAPGLIFPTDRGSQYASALHQALLAKRRLVGSISRKGNCWNSAVMARFFANLKMERVWQRDYANHAEATSDIADYILSFYNGVRRRSRLGNLPPIAFEHQSAITQAIGVCEIT